VEDHPAQYADDASLIVLGEELSMTTAISTLETFCTGSGLVMNWDKSSGYWQSSDPQGRPPWTHQLNLK